MTTNKKEEEESGGLACLNLQPCGRNLGRRSIMNVYPLEGAARGRLQLRFGKNPTNPPPSWLCVYKYTFRPCLSLAARVTDEAAAVTSGLDRKNLGRWF